MHAFIALIDDSPSFLSHRNSEKPTNICKLNSHKRRRTQLNACTQMSNAEFSWPDCNHLRVIDSVRPLGTSDWPSLVQKTPAIPIMSIASPGRKDTHPVGYYPRREGGTFNTRKVITLWQSPLLHECVGLPRHLNRRAHVVWVNSGRIYAHFFVPFLQEFIFHAQQEMESHTPIMGLSTVLVAALIFEVSAISGNDIRDSHLDLNRHPALFAYASLGEWATFLHITVAKATVFEGLLRGEQSWMIILARDSLATPIGRRSRPTIVVQQFTPLGFGLVRSLRVGRKDHRE
ncbi:hypothetical protein ARMSODRAFT_983478 [Armillaria solidipes]|uniref:Uncharacterized protein n=1 Tax=Armillaria solidipes TaxID=1076256 RepID=A0A2H3AJ19_9AGAR|nr:hypothetical protein ARMSODRAFT_983478 [Armillaria solidipes]